MTSQLLGSLTRDGRILFATRILRLFAYGALSVVLVLYLSRVGLSEARIGLLLTLTLLGDTLISLGITTTADRAGRRRMLVLGAALMVFAGVLFVLTRDFFWLLFAATVGVISPSGYEVGPFLSIEQAVLAHIVPNERRTRVFAWYNLVGSFATAAGALTGGLAVQALDAAGVDPLWSHRAVILGYAVAGAGLALLFLGLSRSVETSAFGGPGQKGEAGTASGPAASGRFGLTRSHRVVFKLSALFSLDAFGGGFVIQSILAYWFYLRFGMEPGWLGGVFFGANVLAGISGLLAARVADRIGLVNTMVFTHIPSNVLLILVPFMPTAQLAVAMLLLRFSISQMDVPTRQSYTMAVVAPEERSAAAGITGVARTVGASVSPLFTGLLLSSAALMNLPFILSGGFKIVYDLLLYREFRSVKPPEEG